MILFHGLSVAMENDLNRFTLPQLTGNKVD